MGAKYHFPVEVCNIFFQVIWISIRTEIWNLFCICWERLCLLQMTLDLKSSMPIYAVTSCSLYGLQKQNSDVLSTMNSSGPLSQKTRNIILDRKFYVSSVERDLRGVYIQFMTILYLAVNLRWQGFLALQLVFKKMP